MGRKWKWFWKDYKLFIILMLVLHIAIYLPAILHLIYSKINNGEVKTTMSRLFGIIVLLDLVFIVVFISVLSWKTYRMENRKE